ncbi:hypothetical protein HFN51_37115 [Rhizobium leguminosarum]|nr:hypothetical protein [Rhizobium leguminosarum]
MSSEATMPFLCAYDSIPEVKSISTVLRAEEILTLTDRFTGPYLYERAMIAAAGRDSCVLVTDDAFSAFGASLAVLTNRALLAVNSVSSPIDTWEQVANFRSAILVLTPRTCARWGLDYICDSMQHLTRKDSRLERWGILTATDEVDIANLIARIHARTPVSEPRGQVFSTDPFPDLVTHPLRLITLPGHPAEEIAQLASQSTPYAHFIGHGRSYCALRGNLCSRQAPAEPGDTLCVGDTDCLFSAYGRQPARSLKVDTVVVESCSAASFLNKGPEAQSCLNLAVHLLSGYATTVIAPYRTNSPKPYSWARAWAHAQPGATVGEVCQVLNTLASPDDEYDYLRSQPYVLFGDPDTRVFLPGTDIPRVAIQPSSKERRFILPASEKHIETYSVAPAVSTHRMSPVKSHSSKITKAWIEPIEENVKGRATRLLVVRSTPKKQLSVHMPLRPVAPMVALLGDVVMALTADDCSRQLAEDIPSSDYRPYAHLRNNLIENCKDREAFFVASTKYPAFSIHNSRILDALQRNLVDDVRHLNNHLLKLAISYSTSNRSFWLRSFYATKFGITDVEERPAVERCPDCGSIVKVRSYDVGLWPQRRRAIWECEACMFLYDTPGVSAIIFSGPDVAFRNQDTQFSIQYRNCTDSIMVLSATVLVDRLQFDYECFSVAPVSRNRILRPGASTRLFFKLNLAAILPRHQFNVKALLAINGRLSMAFKKVRIA